MCLGLGFKTKGVTIHPYSVNMLNVQLPSQISFNVSLVTSFDSGNSNGGFKTSVSLHVEDLQLTQNHNTFLIPKETVRLHCISKLMQEAF